MAGGIDVQTFKWYFIFMQYCTAVNNFCLLINSSSIYISLSVKYNCTKVHEYILFRNKNGIYIFKFIAAHKLRTSQKKTSM
jgi:hypothetical protein